jgi:hypothetical protein
MMIERSTNEARQGQNTGVFSILRISLLLAAVALMAAFVFTAMSTNQEAEAPTTSTAPVDGSI